MDPNNFMMGGGMPQGQMPQGHMQRPQPGNENDQIHGRILEEMRKMNINQVGWQTMLDVRERANWIMQLVSSLRMLNPDVLQCIIIAVRFEASVLNGSMNKDDYSRGIRSKLSDVTRQRQQKAQNMMQQNGQPGMPLGLMPQTPMQQSRSNQGEMPNGFNSHFQNQMQASPMNMQMQNQAMGNMNPQNRMPQQNQPPRPNVPQGNQLSQEENQHVMRMATQKLHSLPQEQHAQMRNQIEQKMNPQHLELLKRQGQDPLLRQFYTMALKSFVQQKAQAMNGQQNQQMNPAGNPINGMHVANMQRQVSQANQQPVPNSNGDIDFSAFIGQQADALKLQESGQLVVPASNNMAPENPNNNAAAMNNMSNVQQLNLSSTNGGQVPAGMNPMQMQQMMIERNTQAQMRHAQAQLQAQTQVRNVNAQNPQQNIQLRGQPGGLNANQPMQQSPAMSMLNRPMIPPGQQGDTTPQQRPSQPAQPLGPMPNQGMVSQQDMVQQNGQAAMQMGSAPFPPNMPVELRQRISKAPEEQRRQYIERWLRQQNPTNQQAAGQQNMQAPSAGPTGQPGNQNHMGLPVNNNGNGGQPFAMNLPNGGQAGGAAPNMSAQEHQQKILAQKHRVQQLDVKQIPDNLVQHVLGQVPPGVTTFGHLKQFIGQNQNALPPDVMDKLRKVQVFLIKQNSAQEARPNSQQLQGPPMTTQQPVQPTIPSTQAPVAPMVVQPSRPNQMQSGQNSQPNMPNLPIPPPSAQEIQQIKQRFPEATDQEVRQWYIRMKMTNLERTNPQLAQQHRATQQQQATLRTGQSVIQAQNHAAPMTSHVAPQAQMQPVNSSSQGPPSAQPSQQSGVQGVVPQANGGPQRQGQSQPGHVSAGQGRIAGPTPDQLAKMTPEQRQRLQSSMNQQQQTEALKRAQAQPGHQGPVPQAGQPAQNLHDHLHNPLPPHVRQAHNIRAQSLMIEIENGITKGPPIATNGASLQASVEKLHIILPLINKVEQSAGFALGLFGEETVRKILRQRAVFNQQMDMTGNIKGYISVPLSELEQIDQEFRKYLRALMLKISAQQQWQARNQQQQQMSSQAQDKQMQQGSIGPGQQTHQKPQAPIQGPPKQAATNVSRPAGQGRKASSSKPPSAPITEQPPFQIGHAPSPHGVPVYDGKVGGLNPDKLHLPTGKKRKGGATASANGTPVNQVGTPGSVTSPQLGKTASPEQRRAPMVKPELPREPEKRFKCSDGFCDYSIKGFEKEEELQKHTEEAHAKIEDPLEFFLEGAAAYFNAGTDEKQEVFKTESLSTDQIKPATAMGKPQAPGLAAVKRQALKVEGQRSGRVKSEALTPTPGPSLSPSQKRAAPSSGQGPPSKHARPSPPSQDTSKKTMRETLAEKAGLSLPTPSQTSTLPIKTRDAPKDDSADLFATLHNTFTDAPNLDGFDMMDLTQNNDFDFAFGAVSPVTPQLTPDEVGSGTGSEASSFDPKSLDLHDNDRLQIALGWTTGAADDLEKMAVDRAALNGGGEEKEGEDGDGKVQRPELTFENVFGGQGLLDYPLEEWRRDEYGRDVFAGMDFS